MFFSYAVIMVLDRKKKSRRKIWAREWLLKRNERGNELRLNEGQLLKKR